ncbi:MAG: ABC transporter substrate-binding protein [Candidatus Hadarchaeales archaeon]
MKAGLAGMLVILVAALLALGYLGYSGKPKPLLSPENTLTTVDDSGKYVEVPQPVERVVLLHSDAGEIVCALGAENLVVGVSPTTKRKMAPKFDNLPEVGSCSSPNYEAILELQPDLVITYSGSVGSEEELRKRLEPLGIRILCLDAYKLELIPRDVRLLGLVLGKGERAEEYAGFFERNLKLIENRVSGLSPENKVRVYVEGHKDYQTASYGTMAHGIVTAAGGLNLAAGEPTSYPIVSPEWVLEKNPDVILKNVGSKVLPGGGRALTDPEPLREAWRSLVGRTGWAGLKAVEENRVYVMSWDLWGGGSQVVAICYAAKRFYPQLFLDLNPSSVHRELMENFWGLEYGGAYVYP